MNSAKDTLSGGLPHSEIPESTIARISPGLFAACHVLHRLSVPRHPPDALTLRLSATPNGKDHIRCSQWLHRTIKAGLAARQAKRHVSPKALEPLLDRSCHRCDKLSLLRRHFVTGAHLPPAQHAQSDALPGRSRSPVTVTH